MLCLQNSTILTVKVVLLITQRENIIILKYYQTAKR